MMNIGEASRDSAVFFLKVVFAALLIGITAIAFLVRIETREQTELEWILIETFPSRHEAEIQKVRLENEGIAVLLQVDDAGGLYPSLAPFSKARILVRA